MADAIDYRDSIQVANDSANRELTQQHKSKTVALKCFTTSRNAKWAARRILREAGYPLASFELVVNRNVFQAQPADRIKLTFSKWGFSNKILRVMETKEGSLSEDEKIHLTCKEDIYYISQETDETEIDGESSWIEEVVVSDLTSVMIVEAPYVLSDDAMYIIPLCPKVQGANVGYLVYMSIDGGTSYSKFGTCNVFQPYGTLVSDYTNDVYEVDDGDGFRIDFSGLPASELDKLQTVTRTQLFTQSNIALLGSEIISFQTVTPITSTVYEFTGIARGRFDTEKVSHTAGDTFYFIGTSNVRMMSNNEIVKGASRYFKFVPVINVRGTNYVGDISTATAIQHTITGRGKSPYRPNNLRCNTKVYNSAYSTDCVLTWETRVRNSGLGTFSFNNPPQNFTPEWEGYFEIEVWVGGALVRTTTAVDAKTWTYTSAMNNSDNGSLANEVTFKVSNYVVSNGINYESDTINITTKKE